MEHRWNARKSVNGDVLIESPRLGKIRAVMRNVSIGGMLVETPATTLPLNTPVMVGFRLPVGESDGGYHLEAMVVRRADKCAGLMFLNLGFGTVECLRERLKASASEPLTEQAPNGFSEGRLSH